MISRAQAANVGLLASGGLDSCILIAHLLEQGCQVQPFYIRSGLYWQKTELDHLVRYLAAVRSPRLADLVVLDLPLADLYEDHWSVTGRGVPDQDTADEAVYLPGRNALLAIKAVLWCQMHGIDELSLAPLGSNPFADATSDFFVEFEQALNRATSGRVRIVRPFAEREKRAVMELGRGLPLELTFSCIAPTAGRHCGACNKCAERQSAFADARIDDLTEYANELTRSTHAAAIGAHALRCSPDL